MNFHFDNLILWLCNGKMRTLTFLPNKVNIITGDSNTGKTAILDIIDYCLFASRHKISDSMINENVEWYGIRFTINEKCYVIARKAPSGNEVSYDYHFSSTGEVPQTFPEINITDTTLKSSLEADFSIDRDTKVSYGGKAVKAGSRISLRYFLLLNTISQDIITHSEEFFDKQKDQRYREALPRTFDLAVGIDTAENILKREKREEIKREIKKLEREESRQSRKQETFYSQLTDIIKTAKEYNLVSEEADMDNAVTQLKQMVVQAETHINKDVPQQYARISAEINKTSRKIRNLQRFSGEYKKYKANLKETNESLKPLDFISNHYDDIIKTSIYHDIILSLKEDHTKIKQAIASKTPLDNNISDIIKSYEGKLKALLDQRALLPEEVKAFENDKAKYIYIGETKAKLDLYGQEKHADKNEEHDKIGKLRANLEELIVEPVEERQEVFIKVLDETIQEYITLCSSALKNYAQYRSSFNYKEKRLQIRKPKTSFIENAGSSSIHMFLHLFLFLGLHELIIARKAPYVPPFLIIDQFSRPYWGEDGKKKEKLDESDISKVKVALTLLNGFIKSANDVGADFQMIVFEHINPELWEGMDNIHLVEKFRDGNALVPEELLEIRG